MINFGTGGWRAEIAKDFTFENIRLLSQGLADYVVKHGENDKPIIIGYDRRFLSDRSAQWIAEVLCANGIKVLLTQRSVPTPFIMHSVKKLGLNYGLEVTASHNPSHYNGVKVIVREGRDAPLETTNELERIINSLTPDNVKSAELSECVENGLVEYLKNPFNSFLDDILALIDVESIRQKDLRILFDPMHGSSAYPLMVIFHTARCTVDIIHNDKDAFFGGIMPAPTEHTLAELAERVVTGGYDLGIGVDGDGDRLGIIDSNGKYIDANSILALLYYYLHEYKHWKGPVVRNLATTHLLDKIAEDLGEKCYEVPVGFKYISSKIDEVDAVLGGESSGGLTVRGHIHGKDSVYAASLFVEMIAKTGKSPTEMLDELKKEYGEYIMEESNLVFPAEDKEAIVNTIMIDRVLPDFGEPCVSVSYEDGCKVVFADNSFVICRFSGTEPLLRVFAESKTKERAQHYINAWRGLLKL